MTLLEHAERELKILVPDPDEMQQSIHNNILEMIKLFAEERHSGSSAAYTIDLLTRLLKYEPLNPLTGEDNEWVDVSEMSGKPMWQNNRCSHVFKDGDKAWDIEGKIFVEPDGSYYTGEDSHVVIQFPYTPKREYVDVDKAA